MLLEVFVCLSYSFWLYYVVGVVNDDVADAAIVVVVVVVVVVVIVVVGVVVAAAATASDVVASIVVAVDSVDQQVILHGRVLSLGLKEYYFYSCRRLGLLKTFVKM